MNFESKIKKQSYDEGGLLVKDTQSEYRSAFDYNKEKYIRDIKPRMKDTLSLFSDRSSNNASPVEFNDTNNRQRRFNF